MVTEIIWRKGYSGGGGDASRGFFGDRVVERKADWAKEWKENQLLCMMFAYELNIRM